MRKLFTLVITAVLLSAIVSSCTKEKEVVPSSTIDNRSLNGPAIDVVVNQIPVAPFTDVESDVDYEVIVVPDTKYNVVVQSDNYATVAGVSATVTGGSLKISGPATSSTQSDTKTQVFVHTPVVERVVVGRKGSINTQGNYTKLDVVKIGSGNVTLSGTTNLLRILTIGAGTVDASDMQAIDVVVNSKGNATTTVAPQSTLDVKLGGNSKVYYSGSPSITQELKGNSQLIHL